VIHFKVKGKRGKIRFVLAHAQAQRLIESYLLMSGHGDDKDGPLFWPGRNNRTGEVERALNTNSTYRNIVRKYGQATGLNVEINGLYVHSMRAGRYQCPFP
jgi:integrase/recombinase XerD